MSGKKSQMATFLTLIMALIFLFVSITLNIGQLSFKKTALSQATDRTALQLGSSIGSYSHYLSQTFLDGKDKKCKFSWSLFFKSLIPGGLFSAFTGILISPLAIMEAEQWKKQNKEFKKMAGDLGYVFPEQALFGALSGVVDDTTRVVDEHDQDEDGATDDKIPRFMKWYNDEYFKNFKLKVKAHQDAITPYVEDMIARIKDFDAQTKGFKGYLIDPFIPLLANIEACPDLKVDVSFWQKGGYDQEAGGPKPCLEKYSSSVCEQYKRCDTEECDDEGDYGDYLEEFLNDAVDETIYEMPDFNEWATEITQKPIDELVTKLLYTALWPQLYNIDPDDGEESGWYVEIGKWQGDIGSWIEELKSIDGQVNACAKKYYCDDDSCYYTCCYNLVDKIPQAIQKLEYFQSEADYFRDQILDFQNNIKQAYNLFEGFKGEIVYEWYDKANKMYRVKAKVEPYPIRMPTPKAYRKKFKKCVKLVNGRGTVTVNLWRYDQDAKTPLWKLRYRKGPEEGSEEEFPMFSKTKVSYDFTTNPPQIVQDVKEATK